MNRIYLCQVRPEGCTGESSEGSHRSLSQWDKVSLTLKIPSLSMHGRRRLEEVRNPRDQGEGDKMGLMTPARVDFCLPKETPSNLLVQTQWL